MPLPVGPFLVVINGGNKKSMAPVAQTPLFWIAMASEVGYLRDALAYCEKGWSVGSG